jgi:hypothetical protein
VPGHMYRHSFSRRQYYEVAVDYVMDAEIGFLARVWEAWNRERHLRYLAG